ncbi:hypothetical protein BJP40_14090 [Streptomyces sp. CC53]|nr:hypothetical protein BJP40_14090 [Streptomyces sp. CC53]
MRSHAGWEFSGVAEREGRPWQVRCGYCRRVTGPPADGFEVAHADRGGSEYRMPHAACRMPLADAWAARFEGVAPVRAFQ